MMVCDLQGHGLKDNVVSALLSFESLIQEEASCQVMRIVKHPLRGPRTAKEVPHQQQASTCHLCEEPLKKPSSPSRSLCMNGALADTMTATSCMGDLSQTQQSCS